MSDISTGAKSGVLAGLLFGIIDGISAYYIILAEKATVIASLPSDPSFSQEQLFQVALDGTVALFIIGGIILGAIVGAIFGWAYLKVPGKTPIRRGLIFGIILWFAIAIVEVLVDSGAIAADLLGLLIIDFLGALLYGFVMGIIFNHYKKREKEREDPLAEFMNQ